MKLELDLFELSFLTEACLPPRPIARTVFFQRVIHEIYHELNDKERANILEWMTRSATDRCEDDELYQEFVARYSPETQYVVTCEWKGETIEKEAFLFNGKYKSGKNRQEQYQIVEPSAIVKTTRKIDL